MNEKIRELAEKSGFFPVPDDTEWDWEYRAENARYEKFAELIVRECIDIVEAQKESLCDNENAWSHWDYGYEEAVNDSVEMVKKHFGVDE